VRRCEAGPARNGKARRGGARSGKARHLIFKGKPMTTVAKKSDTRTNKIERRVCLTGLTDVMFDRYPGDNNTKLEWHQKVYLKPGTSVLSLPTMNIVSLLSSHNTNSAPKRLRDKRKYKDIANACLSFVVPSVIGGGQYIPFLRDGKPIEMGQPVVSRNDLTGEDHWQDPKSGLYLHRAVARLEKGIPNPKERPTLPLPWSIEFMLSILMNVEIKEQEVQNLFTEAGLAIGLGTFRGVFGKYEVTTWE
jgi:hypothetical protein